MPRTAFKKKIGVFEILGGEVEAGVFGGEASITTCC